MAVLEFTLSLTFLIPLVLAALNFGYYFYIGANAEEAARQGVRQAVGIGLNCAAGNVCDPLLVAPIVTQQAVWTGTGPGSCTSGGAAACYMHAPPLSMGGVGGNTTVTCACTAGAVPTYTITVQVDFPPSVSYFKALMPAGATTGTVRYTARLAGSP